jgi:cellulose synthase/poly-beta-1,6-N-acetylglucosamine synthase-like glycosyltransferase
MTCTLIFVFWLSSFLVVYPYLIYPPLLRLLVALSPARSKPRTTSPPHQAVTIIISAFNEEGVIERKLENVLALRFPRERLEVIVSSDASSDRTDDIVRKFAETEPRVRLVRQDERRGKSAALNRAVAAANGGIIVFSDANAMYDRDALHRLLDGFADPGVGYVVGAALYTDAEGASARESEGLYWNLELRLKRLESMFFSVVGGDGAIYAVRRELFWELRDDDISDFVNPLQVIAAGYRGLFNPDARCYEVAGDTFAKEFRRRRRIVNRTWRAVLRYGSHLKVLAHGRFLFMLASHKILRWYALPLILTAWSANAALLGEAPVYQYTWLAINASMAIAVLGHILDRLRWPQIRLVSILHYFYAINLAAVLGIWDEFRGVRHVTWDHIRQPRP